MAECKIRHEFFFILMKYIYEKRVNDCVDM